MKIFNVSQRQTNLYRILAVRLESCEYIISLAPIVLTPPSSLLSAIPNDDVQKQSREKLDESFRSTNQDSESSAIKEDENQLDHNSTQNTTKTKSSSDELSKHFDSKSDQSQENLSIHPSLQSEIRFIGSDSIAL